MSYQPTPISDLLEDLIEDPKYGQDFKRGMLLSVYIPVIAKIVGSKGFAQFITRREFRERNGKLEFVIHISHPVWRHELASHKIRIRDALNERVKSDLIDRVVF